MTKHIHIHLPVRKTKDSEATERAKLMASTVIARNKTRLEQELKKAEEAVIKRSNTLLGRGDRIEQNDPTIIKREKIKAELAKYKDAKDAGFTTYDPREVARLNDEIKELEAKIKAEKSPFKKKDLEQVLVKVKRERSKYHDAESGKLAASRIEHMKKILASHEKMIASGIGLGGAKLSAKNIEALKKEAEKLRAEIKRTQETAHDAFPTKFSIHGRNYVSAGKLRNNGQQACYEELDASGKRTGRMVWMTTGGQVVADAKDAANKFVTKVDIRLPDEPAFGNRAGRVMSRGTVVYKTGPLYRPWWSKEPNGVLRLNPSDVQVESTTDTKDSEENDAYIKGYRDALAGKPKDQEFHPGGSKKPSVTLKYAEGHKQGTEDRKKRGGKDEGPGTSTMGIRG